MAKKTIAPKKQKKKKSTITAIDEKLFNKAWQLACRVRENAYCPYSKFKVGATIISENGHFFSGCNVENASFGSTICAERNGILQMVASLGATKIKGVVVVTEPEAVPCGMCLQVIAEFASADVTIWMCDTRGNKSVYSLDDLLPERFDGAFLSNP